MKSLKIVLLFGLIVIIGMAIMPLRAEVQTLSQELATLKAKQSALKTTFAQIQTHREKAARGESSYYVPKGMNQAEAITDIERIIAQSGFRMDGYSFSRGFNDATGLSQLSTGFQLEGERSSLLRFMQLVESNPRVMSMDGLSVAETDDGRYSLSAAINVFYVE